MTKSQILAALQKTNHNMLTIWKVILKVIHKQDIEVPAGTQILCAGGQGDDVCVWFRCDPSATKIKRTILIYGTGGNGAPSYCDANYLGTAIVKRGALVWHVFEKI